MEQENGARIFLGELSGAVMTLGEEEAAHCVKVLRHREGDAISIIDGRGTLYHCRIVTASPRSVEASVIDSVPDFGTHGYHLTMAVCPTKNLDRYEWFAEKATEVGVDVIAPVFGDRSERRVIKTDRLKRIVLSAAKQSLKGAVPEIAEPVSVRDFIEGAPKDSLRLICYCIDDEGQRRSITEVLQALIVGGQSSGSGTNRRDINILIGPEGDFSEDEVNLALSEGWQPVHLGSSRLRTETAALTAATAVYFSFFGE